MFKRVRGRFYFCLRLLQAVACLVKLLLKFEDQLLKAVAGGRALYAVTFYLQCQSGLSGFLRIGCPFRQFTEAVHRDCQLRQARRDDREADGNLSVPG